MGKTLKVLELFGGIGACSKALTNLGVKHEIADLVEIDRFAVKSFNAVHGTNFEPQDITKWDKDIDVDLIMHGSPCQDFSMAGRQAGGDEGSGTRSSLMYETIRIVEKLKPKYVIWENVKNLLSEKHRPNFEAYQARMKNLGYKNFVQVLNAKDYGIPQNRERVFTVSIREDLGQDHYEFPVARPLTKRLKDVLEDVVDEKYYLPDGKVAKLKISNFNQTRDRIRDKEVASTLCARDYKDPQCVKIIDPQGRSQKICKCKNECPTLRAQCHGNEPCIVVSRGRNPDNPSDRSAGAHVEQRLEPKFDGTSNTITSVQKDNMVLEPPFRIRKLTPKELTPLDFLCYNGVNEKKCKADEEILSILREAVGTEAFCKWAIGGLWCILSEAILWQNMYAKSIFKGWQKQTNFWQCSYHSKKYEQLVNQEERVRDMWCNWQEVRYTSYRPQLPKQYQNQFDVFVQKLPHEITSQKEFVHSLWQTSEGIGLLRQALSEIQEIWQPNAGWQIKWPDYRIRKLTAKSCWRLMGFADEDFEKASKVNSNTQLYKQAGNSIVVNVLEGILANLLKGTEYAPENN